MSQPAWSAADSHDMIEVRGARENNLASVSVDIPKRRLTVFTGVSGSGKSSLVFGTIAAESQRLINETYSAVPPVVHAEPQPARTSTRCATSARRSSSTRSGWAPTPAPPSAPPPTRTRCCGSSSAGSASRTSAAPARSASTPPRACAPTCEGLGRVSDLDIDELVDVERSLNDGAITVPNFAVDSWYWQTIVGSGLFDPDVKLQDFTAAAVGGLPPQAGHQDQGGHQQLDVRGSGRQGPAAPPGQGPRVDAAAHPRLRRPGGHLHHLRRLRRHPAQRGGPVLADRRPQHRRVLGHADQRPGGVRRAASTTPAVAPLLANLRDRSTPWSRSGWATSAWTGSRPPSPAARRSG